jgi:CheY-like chemotaxis protein
MKAFEAQLTRMNYHVTASSAPCSAMEVFRNNPHQFDLVITDLTMPEMNGFEVARKIHAIRPDLPVLLASGFSVALSREELREAGICGLVEKPVSMPALAALLNGALPKLSARA